MLPDMLNGPDTVPEELLALVFEAHAPMRQMSLLQQHNISIRS